MLTRYVWLTTGEVTETGKWCEKCLLPSAVSISLIGYDEHGFTGPLGEMVACPDCWEGGPE